MPSLADEIDHAGPSRPTQANRQLGIDTPLGPDVLLLTAFNGTEELSHLFGFKLNMLSTRDSIDAAQIIGKNVTFWVRDRLGEPRNFNGFVSQFSAGSWSRGFWQYSAEVVPWFWFLTQNTDCRTFVNKTVPRIIEEVFTRHGFRDFETHDLKGTHPTWEYCVQYRESDFNFVSRIMEQEGIFYYFRHENRRHVLVLADQESAYSWCEDREAEYSPADNGPIGADHITAWHHDYRFVPGSWSQTDYNFETPPCSEETPANVLLANESSVVKLTGNDRCQIFDWPGEYSKREDGRQVTRVRMEGEEVPHNVASGSGSCRRFAVGSKFTLRGHESPIEQFRSYVLVSLDHSAVEPSSYSGGNGRAGSMYSNSFTCIPADVRFRPERRTPKPAIHGAQTGIVVGPRGEEIWPDRHGRVLVQFFWDRHNKRTGNNCCWVRCAQSMAGKGWGSMFIPRIGQEVVVSFLDGDPDRPLVTGLVYNADQTPAYPLPQEKTKSYIKTCSSPGGEGFNEVRFEDKKGQEQVFIHAQQDMDVRVRGNHRTSIAGNRDLTVGAENEGNFLQKVAGQKGTKVGSDMNTDVGGNYGLEVMGDSLLNLHEHLRINVREADFVGEEELCFFAKQMILFQCGASRIALEPDRIVIFSPSVSINSEFGPFRGNGVNGVNDYSVDIRDPVVAASASPGHVSTPWPGSAPTNAVPPASPATRRGMNSAATQEPNGAEDSDCHLGGRCG